MSKTIVWTIGGSDSCGGAGIQADLQTFRSIGVCGCSVTTLVTAQNSLKITKLKVLSSEMVQMQLDTLFEEFPPHAVKLSVIGSQSNFNVIQNFFKNKSIPIVFDPIIYATSGSKLNDISKSTLRKFLSFVHTITPNIQEAEYFLSCKITTHDEMKKAAEKLLKLGPKNVLIKGGHLLSTISSDLILNKTQEIWLHDETQENSIHGSGCIFSSAFTAAIAQNRTLEDAFVIAKTYVNQSWSKSNVAQHTMWPNKNSKLPRITVNKKYDFPDLSSKYFGIYPIVSDVTTLIKFVRAGARLIQLRIKNKTDGLEDCIKDSITICRREKVALFINDYWELAIKHKSFGVHLGQEDLQSADLYALQQQDIHLGISTHTLYELCIADQFSPSYIACGPVFATNSKKMSYLPIGFKGVREWRKLTHKPIVAIGGVKRSHIQSLKKMNINAISAISGLTNDVNLEDEYSNWNRLWHEDH